jgi:hypothetical protein
MKRLTRVVLVVALAVGLLWVMWQAVDRALSDRPCAQRDVNSTGVCVAGSRVGMIVTPGRFVR